MPITTSAKKALRQSTRRAGRNKRRKDLLKKTLKEFRGLVVAKKTAEAEKLLPRLAQYADKAAKSGYLKVNTARRIKSRAAHLVAKSSKTSS